MGFDCDIFLKPRRDGRKFWSKHHVFFEAPNRWRACRLHELTLRSGLRVEAPWIDQPGGAPMLDRLRQVLASEVRPTDDGFVFCFCGHGNAVELKGDDMVPTLYQDIVDVINTEPKLRGKPKVVVFDCCQIATSAGLDQLQLPKDMILARSTAFRLKGWEQPGVGNVYSKRLAAAISSLSALARRRATPTGIWLEVSSLSPA